ncbi:MAG: fluoride efflux transporter CrcB [Deltaproteobacteria bacterium]|nr:MAG: fluoride efflux transporter CrcB [Deltaproteobacteria bacterium]
MIPILLVAVGGALGAVARYLVATAFAHRLGVQWPWGTLFINLSGCVLISLFLGAGSERMADSNLRYLLPIGFVGAYTTFSTYEYETMRLFQLGRGTGALAYVAASNLLGFAAVCAGAWLGRR